MGLTRAEGEIVRSSQILNVLKVEIVGFREGPDMGYGSKRGVKDNSKVFGLNISKDEVLTDEIGKTGRTRFAVGTKVWSWMC